MNLYIKSAEERLEKVLPTLASGSQATSGVFLNLSKLKMKKNNDEHIKVATNILRDHLQSGTGDIFVLQDGDVIITYNGNNIKALEDATFHVRYLFADDPLAYHNNGIANQNFCQRFYNRENWDQFINICETKIKPAANDGAALPRIRKPLLPLLITTVEDAIAELTLEDFALMRPVYMQTPKAPEKLIFTDLIVKKDYLRAEVIKKLDFIENDNLFAYFLEFIELKLIIKLLHLLRMRGDSSNGGYGLALSFNILKSEEFSMFDTAISDKLKRSMVLSISIGDIYHNVDRFFTLRDTLKEKGYKICLDTISPETFLHIDREFLGVDLIKLDGSQMGHNSKYKSIEAEVRQKIQASGSSRIILTNFEADEIRNTGQELDIILYQ
jgi:hypothetical protein